MERSYNLSDVEIRTLGALDYNNPHECRICKRFNNFRLFAHVDKHLPLIVKFSSVLKLIN
jgi:hypothetical protein